MERTSEPAQAPLHPSAVCSTSPNRALWRSLTSLQAENSELKVKISALERKSAGELTLAAAGGGSSKFLRMELEHAQEVADALRQQLEAAEAQAAGTNSELSALRQQLEGVQAQLQQRDAELGAKEGQLSAAASEAATLRAEAAAAAARAEGLERSLVQASAAAAAAEARQAELSTALRGTKGQLQFVEAELKNATKQAAAAQAAAAAAQAALQEERARQEKVEAGFLSEVARLESTVATLQEQQRAQQAAAVPASPASPGASLGAHSDAGGGGDASVTPRPLIPSGVPSSAAATVYNVVLVPASSPREQPEPSSRRSSQGEERLAAQVLSLQDKLGTLQAAHEALLADYSLVTEQLAARQAEVQLARLSPESAQLKQQVLSLQDQVLALQQELFASRSFSRLSNLPLGAPAEESAGASGRTGSGERRSLKRSFTRAASSLGRKMGLMRRPKSSASLGTMSDLGSRGTSATESVGSHSGAGPSSAGASPFTPLSLSPYIHAAGGLLPPVEDGEGQGPAHPHPHPHRHSRAPGHAEVLLLRQQLLQREGAAAQLEAQLAAEAAKGQQLQEALQEQGCDLAEAKQLLAQKQAELELASKAAAQLMAVQKAVPTQPAALPSGAEHSKCREAVAELFRQVWRERMARQRAELALEQHSTGGGSSRRSTLSGIDEETAERLAAEAKAADTLAEELARAKGHQLQLQQRLEALQLQLAKQSTLLQLASPRPRPSPRTPHSRGPGSPSKEAIAQHNALRVAEARAQAAELRSQDAEQRVTALQRRERGLNQAVAQAAVWRRRVEARHEQAREALRRRLAEERWQRERMQAQVHATAVAQTELLSGLEVLQALLLKKGEAGAGPARSPGRTPSDRGRLSAPRASTSTDTQEALRQISGMLGTVHTHLQILSPQQSDVADSTGPGEGRSPPAAGAMEQQQQEQQEHRALSISTLARLSDPEPLPEPAPQQPAAAGAGAGGQDGWGTPQAGDTEAELDDVLLAVLGGRPSPAAAHVAALPSQGSWAVEPARSSSSATAGDPAASPSQLLPRGGSISVRVPSLPSGSSEPSEAAWAVKGSSSSHGSSSRAERLQRFASSYTRETSGLSRQQSTSPAHMPAGWGEERAAGSPHSPATAPPPQGSPRSPRLSALANKLSSGLKHLACKEPKTRSGSSSPAAAVAPKSKLARSGSSGGDGNRADGLRGSKAPTLQRSSPLKPRKVWV